MYNIRIGRYYNTHSSLHDMNPAYKLICLLLFCLLLLLLKNVFILIIVILFVLSLMVTSNVPYRLYINSIKTILPLVAFMFVIDLIFDVSIINTVLVISKLILIVVYSSIIMYTTTPDEITYGIQKILSPFNILNKNVNSIAFSISLAIRFIPIIFEQSSKVLKSQASRGHDFNNGNLKVKAQALISIIFPMFMLSLKRADDIADIMEVRMYNPNIKIVNLKTYRNLSFDGLILFSHILLIFIYFLKVVIA